MPSTSTVDAMELMRDGICPLRDCQSAKQFSFSNLRKHVGTVHGVALPNASAEQLADALIKKGLRFADAPVAPADGAAGSDYVEPAAIPAVDVAGRAGCNFPGMHVWRGTVGADAVELGMYAPLRYGGASFSDELVKRDAVISQFLRADRSGVLDRCGNTPASLGAEATVFSVRMPAAETLRSLGVRTPSPEDAACNLLFAAEAAHLALTEMHCKGLAAGGLSPWSLALQRGARWSWYLRWSPLVVRLTPGVKLPPLPVPQSDLYRHLGVLTAPWAEGDVNVPVDAERAMRHDWWSLGVVLGQACVGLATADYHTIYEEDAAQLRALCLSVQRAEPVNALLGPVAKLAVALIDGTVDHAEAFRDALGEPVSVMVKLAGGDPITVVARPADTGHALRRRVLRELRQRVGDSVDPVNVELSWHRNFSTEHVGPLETVAQYSTYIDTKHTMVVSITKDDQRKAPEHSSMPGPSTVLYGPISSRVTAAVASPQPPGGRASTRFDLLCHATNGFAVRFPAATFLWQDAKDAKSCFDAFTEPKALQAPRPGSVHFRRYRGPPRARIVASTTTVVQLGCDSSGVSVRHYLLTAEGMANRRMALPVIETPEYAKVLDLASTVPLHPHLALPAMAIEANAADEGGVAYCPAFTANTGLIPPQELKVALDDIESAVKHLHANGLSHGDVARYCCVDPLQRGLLVVSPWTLAPHTSEAAQDDLDAIDALRHTTP